MTRDELLLFVVCDSAHPARATTFKHTPSVSVLHTAFADPTAPEGEPLRESIDVRVLLSFSRRRGRARRAHQLRPDEGKLATIIDIVDGNKCLVDGPATKTGVARQVIPFKRVALTDIVVKIPKNARQKTLNKAWDGADVLAKWDASSWAKKLAAKKKRASLTDFQRFQLMVARKQRSAIVAAKVKEMS
ncbi:hypothetical protein JL720_2975 [Aureococcus anophagefferens]|nr:hypothetical protein JL720_2975 [Aureococcus anophagefferens]